MKHLRSFFKNGCILTATALLMRSTAMLFRIYLSRKLGATGLGLFTLIMSVYGFALTLATSGIHLATVHLTCHALAEESESELRGALRRCLGYSLSFGGAAAFLLFFLAPAIGSHWLNDVRTVSSLRILALGLPCLAVSSCINGYFHGVRRVTHTAVVQVMEQIVYMMGCAFLLSLWLPKGLEFACLAVVLGGLLADGLSMTVTVLLYRRDRRKHPLQRHTHPRGLTATLLSVALPVAVSAYARSALLTIEHILIPRGLQKFQGNGEDALASYGVLHGMALPAVLFAQAFLASFAGLLVAELSESQARGDQARLKRIFGRVWKATLPFCIGVSCLLYCFSDALGTLIYHQPQAGTYIRYLAPLVVVMYLDTVTDNMLKGLGEQVYSMRVNIIDSAISVVGVWLLLPRYGLTGYFVVLYFCEILNAVCSVGWLLWKLRTPLPLLSAGLPALLSSLGTFALWQLFKGFGLTAPVTMMGLLSQLVFFSLIYLVWLWGMHNGRLPKRKQWQSILFST